MYLGADGAVKVWNTRSGKLIHTFEGHLAGISTISWSPDGATIASGSDDKTIRLWNVLTVVPCVYLCLFDQTNVFFPLTGQSSPYSLCWPPQLRLPNCLFPKGQHVSQRFLR